MVEDAKGEWHWSKLLHTIHPKVLEALIIGDIAHQYKASQEFQDYLYKKDNTAGVYLVTFMLTGSLRGGLTRLQWMEIKDMIIRYCKGLDRKITARSTQFEIDDAEEAVLIESRWLSLKPEDKKYKEKMFELKVDVYNGKRALFYKDWMTFCGMLRLRMNNSLDPVGNAKQIQGPVQIGCSKHVELRLGDHDDLEGLDASAKPFSLLFSCIEVKKWSPVAVRLPILKIWHQDQLKVAEILVTMLASSMLEDGGLNCHPPGSRGMRGDEVDVNRFNRALEDISSKGWAVTNLQKSREALEARELMLRNFALLTQHVKPDPVQQLLNGKNVAESVRVQTFVDIVIQQVNNRIATSVANAEKLGQRHKAFAQAVKDREEELEAIDQDLIERLKMVVRDKKAELAFYQEIENLLW